MMWNKTIPQKYYLFWDGSPMSWLQVLTVTSFHRLNPDWEIFVYEPTSSYKELKENTFTPDYFGKDYYPMLKELDYINVVRFDLTEFLIKTDSHGIQCSDQWRIKMLYNNGGMYSDFDVLWLKPMTEFMDIECIGNTQNFEAIVSLSEYTKGYHSNSNLIAEVGSLYLKSIIDASKNLKPPYKHTAFGAMTFNQLYPTLARIHAKFPRVLAVQYKTFFPYGLYDLHRLFLDTDLSPIASKDVMAIHWYNGAGEAKDYVNKADYDRPCSMTTVLRNEGWFDEIKL